MKVFLSSVPGFLFQVQVVAFSRYPIILEKKDLYKEEENLIVLSRTINQTHSTLREGYMHYWQESAAK